MDENDRMILSRAEFEQCSSDKPLIDGIFPYSAIHYITQGYGFFNGVRLGPGQFFCAVTDSYVSYSPDPDDPWAYYWFNLEGYSHREILHSFGIDPEKSYGSFFCIHEVSAILQLFEQYQAKFVNNNDFFRNLAYTLLSLHQAEPKEVAVDSTAFRRIREIKRYIDMNFHHDLSIEAIAETFFVSRPYLRNLFVRYLQISPKQYLQKVRMEKAAQLLLETGHEISLIASSVGYRDIFTFSKAFKKYYGMTPSAYRRAEAQR